MSTANFQVGDVPLYQPVGLARHRIKLTIMAFTLLIITEMLWGFKPLNPLQFSDAWVLVGSIMILLGLAIRSWAAGLLVKKETLAVQGPYRLVRHPLYAGSTLMMCGFALLLGQSLILVATAIIAVALFGAAIRGEEKFLAAKFGEDWKRYAASTSALFPTHFTWELLAPWTLQRWLLNHEYNAWLGTLLGWLSVCVWHFWR